jgi:cysteine-rich repeat protein
MVTYTPDPDNDQDDSFTFTVNDGGQPSAPATFSIDVIPVNDGPTAVADNDSTLLNTPFTRVAANYTSNDTDIDGPALSISAATNPTNGTVSLDVGAQTITFTPAANFSGTAGFDYTVTDGSRFSSAHVTVTVINTNTPPTAVDDNDTTDEDTPVTRPVSFYIANDTDPDPQTLMIQSVLNPQNGSVVLGGGNITFTPNANFVGNGSFDYVVTDGIATDTGTVTIAVTSVDDLPVASNDSDTVNEDGNVNTNVLANDTGLGDGGLVVTVTVQATNGVAVAQGNNTVTYTPNADYNGPDAYTYTVTDGDGDMSSAVVSITVDPQNDAPTVGNQTLTMNENTTLTVTLTGADIDLPAQPLTFNIATLPASGTLGTVNSTGPTTATVTYTPVANFTGPVSFTYTATDGTATSAPGTIAITVNNVVVCNDGLVEAPEQCDDQGNGAGDGCSATCTTEQGWSCVGAPSNCDPICNDGLVLGGEACDDGNGSNTDGCTTLCELGVVCTVGTFADGDRFAVSPGDGHCYVSFDTEQTTWANAQTACTAINGHLASITSAGEQTVVASVQNTLENPWIGATDAVVEGSFGWITAEPFVYNNFEPGQPDGGEPEDCVNLFSTAVSPSSTAGTWNDASCDFIGFTAGRICEIETGACGNGTLEVAFGEGCDDGNRNSYDGCSLACQVEPGAACSGTAPTTCAKLVINEFDYDMAGTDATEFVEILNTGTATANLANHIFVHVNGSGGAEILRVALSGNLSPQQYLVICPMTPTPGTCPAGLTVAPGAVILNFGAATNILQNDNEGIGIFNLGNNSMVDAVSYEGAVTTGTVNGVGTFSFVEGTTATAADTAASANQRFPNARDTQRNSVDFVLRLPTPGAATPP